MILVTGVSGTVGAEVADLLARGAHARRLMAGNAAAARARYANTEVVHGDFADAASLDRALRGVDTVFLATAPGPTVAAHDRAMIAAAVRARVKKIVKLSGASAATLWASAAMISATAAVGAWHRPGEEALASSGLAWTTLRPSSFASNARRWIPFVRDGKALPIPTGDGRQGVIDPRDIAEVAVAALLSAKHDGKTYTLTGPDRLSGAEQVAILGKILRKELTGSDLSIAEMQTQLLQAGMPPDYVEAVSEGLRYVREGRSDSTSDDVARILGRPPRSFADWARANAGLFG
jgi:uncharacterized protein YbjT (DUF2867 family)